MRILIGAIILGFLCYLCFTYKGVVEQIKNGVNIFGSIDADSLEGRALEPFALPKGHCKAFFPGKPHVPAFSQELFSSFQYAGTTYVLADKAMTYYLSELSLPTLAIGITDLSSDPAFFKSKFSEVNFGSSQGGITVANNEATRANNLQSDAVNTQKALDQFADSWRNARSAAIDNKVAVDLYGGRFSGRDISGQLKDAKTHFHLRFFCDYPNKRLIAVGVVGSPERVLSSSSGKFVDSLEIW